MALALMLVFGLAAPAMATGTEEDTTPAGTWEEIESSSRRTPNRDAVESQDNEPLYADSDVVRVSIVLEGASTLQAGYATTGIANNTQALSYRDGLQAQQDSVANEITMRVLGGKTLDVVWNLTLAANIISANIPFGKINAIKAVDGVKDVVLETRYEPMNGEDTDDLPGTDDPDMYRAVDQTGTDVVWAEGITGAGGRIAVIDTGIETDHISFSGEALEYSLALNAEEKGMTYEDYVASLNLLTAEEVESVKDQLNVTIDPETAYVSTKIPFAYNYVDTDYDVTHRNDAQGNHGSHVEGIAAANIYVADGEGGFKVATYTSTRPVATYEVRGQAPDAQIITMKVFGKNGGAYDSDYMAAIEDAIVLGCDSANLSLGSSSAGFVTSDLYQDILDSLEESDIVVSISMGNSYQWSYYGFYGMNPRSYNVYSDDVNFYTGGSPGSFANAFTVASVGGANANANNRYTMSSFSSWGVPSDLSLKPEITAPGGSIISVNGNNTTGYTSMSGTSMAAPQIAGIAALAAQYIRENDVLEAARRINPDLTLRALSQSLIMSTATPIYNNSGLIYPVIQQGAGLARIDKLMAAKTFVMMDESATASAADGKVKAELGDDPEREGVYTVAFTLNNLTEEDVNYDLRADFFTQALTTSRGVEYLNTTTAMLNGVVTTWLVDGKEYDPAAADEISDNFDFNGDGKVTADDAQALLDYVVDDANEIENLDYADLDEDGDVDTYDAYLVLALISSARVIVPANSSVEIVLTSDISAAIADYDINGAYVEGYIYATETGATEAEHSIPVLGYYGSWTDPSMFNKGSYIEYYLTGEETRSPYFTYFLDNADLMQSFLFRYAGDEFGYPIGGNMLIEDEEYHAERNAISALYGDEINSFQYSAIRNYAGSRFTVTVDGEDEPRVEILGGSAFGLYFDPNSGSTYNTNAVPDLNWQPTDIENNTRVTLSFSLAPEYYLQDDGSIDWDALGDGATRTLSLMVDNEAPAVETPVVTSKGLAVNASDNQYIAAIFVSDEEGNLLFQQGADEEAEPGDVYSVMFTLDDLAQGVQIDDLKQTKLLVEVYDYALNVTTFRYNPNKDELQDPDISIDILDSDGNVIDELEIVGTNSKSLTADVQPWGVDDTVIWTTSDPAVATVTARGVVTGVEVGTATITATLASDPSISASATVTVRFIETVLNALVCDENGESYVIEFTMRDLPTYTELHEEPLSDWVYETAVDRDGTIYVTTYDGSNQSPLYTLDLENWELEQIGTGTRRTYFSDISAVGDNLYDSGVLAGVYSTNFYLINKTNGSVAQTIAARNYVDGSTIIGIDFYKTVDDMDHFLVVTMAGNVYDLGVTYNAEAASSKYAIAESTLLFNYGKQASYNSWQDLYLDSEGNLYWSLIDLGLSRVDLIVAEPPRRS